MKKRIVIGCMMLMCMAGLSGCSGETATGMAVGGGVSELLRETFAGAEKDIARKKASAIAAYNEGVTQGKSVAELDELQEDVDKIIKIEAGKDVGKTLLGFNYTNPKSGDITTLIELGIILLGGKKLSTVAKKYSAEKKGCLLYTSPSPRDRQRSRMPSSA